MNSRHSRQTPYKQDAGIRGALSKHETDFVYLAETSGDSDLKFARSKDMAIDTTMTNFVRAYKFEEQTFIGDIVAPRRAVSSKIGRYKNRGKEALDINVSDTLSDRGKFNEIGFAVSESTYLIDPKGLIAFCSDEEIEESSAVQAAMEATILLKAACNLRQEIRIRNLADATSNTATPGVNWDTSTVINGDVAAAKAAMKSVLGFGPNYIALGDQVVDSMIANVNIKNDITAAAALQDGRQYLGQMTGSDLAATTKPWGMQLLMPDCMYNSSAPGLALPATLPRVWGDEGYLFRIDRETRSMTWALQFELLREMIVRWRTENPGGWYYKLVYKRVVKEITPEAVYKLIDLLS